MVALTPSNGSLKLSRILFIFWERDIYCSWLYTPLPMILLLHEEGMIRLVFFCRYESKIKDTKFSS